MFMYLTLWERTCRHYEEKQDSKIGWPTSASLCHVSALQAIVQKTPLIINETLL